MLSLKSILHATLSLIICISRMCVQLLGFRFQEWRFFYWICCNQTLFKYLNCLYQCHSYWCCCNWWPRCWASQIRINYINQYLVVLGILAITFSCYLSSLPLLPWHPENLWCRLTCLNVAGHEGSPWGYWHKFSQFFRCPLWVQFNLTQIKPSSRGSESALFGPAQTCSI